MMIDVQNLTILVGLGISLTGICAALFNLFYRFKALEAQAKHSKNDDEIILKSLMAILDGLHEIGCNNTVTKMREELDKHLVESR
jgi:hypothetical protein